jgi:hypothetical protein
MFTLVCFWNLGIKPKYLLSTEAIIFWQRRYFWPSFQMGSASVRCLAGIVALLLLLVGTCEGWVSQKFPGVHYLIYFTCSWRQLFYVFLTSIISRVPDVNFFTCSWRQFFHVFLTSIMSRVPDINYFTCSWRKLFHVLLISIISSVPDVKDT